MVSKNIVMSLVGLSLTTLSACAVADGYSDSEKEMISTMTPSKYQPATREMRTSVETQDVLAQAAFWSREYQLNPADLEAAVKLSAAVRKMGNASKAVEITQTTRAMFPNDPYLIAEHAAALIALERGSEAIKPLDDALRAAPGYARLWSLKGAALDQMSEYDLARQHYEKALQISPQDPNIMANMGLSFALAGDPVTAEKWLSQAANHPEATPGIKHNYNLVLQLQGKPTHTATVAPQAPAPRPVSIPVAARQSSAKPNQNYQSAPAQSPVLGHRSNLMVVGQEAGAPSSAAEMAHRIASQNTQNKVVVPHQPAEAPQENILHQIARSVNGKQAAAMKAHRPAPPQHMLLQQQMPMQAEASAYPNPYARQVPNGYPVHPQAYQTPSERRGAARRR